MTITKEGALASFYTTNKAPIKHLRVYFSPKQAGEGDPSPENVREIEGINYITVYSKGTSIIDFTNGTVRWYVPENFLGKDVIYQGLIDNTLGTTTVRLSLRPRDANNVSLGTYYSTQTVAPGECKNIWAIFKITTQTNNIQFSVSNATSNTIVKERGLWLYNSEDYVTIDFDSSMYGGYVDLVTGELVEEWSGSKTLDGSDDTSSPNRVKILMQYPDIDVFGAGRTFSKKVDDALSTVYCDSLPIMTELTSNNFPYLYLNDNGTSIGYIVVIGKLSEYSELTTDSAKLQFVSDWLKEHNVTIYWKSTPIIHQLTSTQLQTLIGRNNIWSNADRIEVEYDLAESNDELYRRRNILLRSAPHIETASGNITTFNTDTVAPIKSAVVKFNPVQEGSGDPSPSNIRTINGWTDLLVYHDGENLYIPNTNNKGYINASGTIVVDDNNTYTDLIPVTVGSTYSFKCTTAYVNGSTNRRVHGYNSSGNWIQQITVGTTAEKTVENKTILIQVPNGISYIRVSFKKEDTNVSVRKENVYNVDWSNEGTIYGGYVDLISGEVWKTWNSIALDILQWENFGGNGVFYYTVSRKVGQQIYSNILTPTLNAGSSYDAVQKDQIFYYKTNSTYKNYLMTRNPDFAGDKTGYRAWIRETYPGAKLVYELETPRLITTLTQIQLKSLHGINNIWSNANGNIEVKYWTH